MARNPINYMEVDLSGNIGAKPELREQVMPNGTVRKVCNFSIAINHQKQDPANPNGRGITVATSWIQVSAWDSLASLASQLDKGALVRVTGELYRAGAYTTKDGREGFQVSVIATNIAEPLWRLNRNNNAAPAAEMVEVSDIPAPPADLLV